MITEKTIEQYQAEVLMGAMKCKNCHADIRQETIKGLDYDHSGGLRVKFQDHKKWLYLTCPKCGYDTSLVKLGFPREGF